MAERAEPESGRAAARGAVPPNTPGSRLRARREERALDLGQAAADLRVDAWMLEALEKDDYAAFGAPVFAKGHLRKYAALLGISSDDIMVAYYQLEGARDAPPLVTEAQAASVPPPRSPILAIVLVVAALVALAVVVWIWLADETRVSAVEPPAIDRSDVGSGSVLPAVAATSRRSREAAQLLVPAPDGGAVPGSEPGARGATVGTEMDRADDPTALAPDGRRMQSVRQRDDEETDGGQLSTPNLIDPTVAAPAARPATLAGADGTVEVAAAATTGEPLRISIAFEQESWVEITDAGGRRLLYGLGTAGSVESMQGRPPIEVFLGRAPGVMISVDDQPFVIPEDARRGNVARFSIQREDNAL